MKWKVGRDFCTAFRGKAASVFSFMVNNLSVQSIAD